MLFDPLFYVHTFIVHIVSNPHLYWTVQISRHTQFSLLIHILDAEPRRRLSPSIESSFTRFRAQSGDQAATAMTIPWLEAHRWPEVDSPSPRWAQARSEASSPSSTPEPPMSGARLDERVESSCALVMRTTLAVVWEPPAGWVVSTRVSWGRGSRDEGGYRQRPLQVSLRS